MLRIPEFGIAIDCPDDCGLASRGGIHLYGPLHGQYGVGITKPGPGDDPAGDLEEKYALMAALGPVGDKGATFLNRRDPAMPFIGAIRNPHTEQLYLLSPYNHKGLPETDLRKVIGELVKCIGFVSASMSQWDEMLRGRTFTAAETYQRQLGSSDGYSAQEDITFRGDGMYEQRISGHTSISSGGLTLGRVRDDREQGRWDVVEGAGGVGSMLRLDSSQGGRALWSLSRTADAVLFEGRRFVRTK